MSESGGSWDPGAWKGYDFNTARIENAKPLDPVAGRGYDAPVSDRYSPLHSYVEAVPKTLTTDARSPLMILTDGTGSMGDFPQKIFSKLPLLDLTIDDYLDGAEISFGLVQDYCDTLPLQMRPFGRKLDLKAHLGSINIQGGGGGNECEAYELAALYAARNVEMPKATRKPILIYVCDEGIYPSISPVDASRVHVDLKRNLQTKELFEELNKKWSVYCIRKHYNGLDGEQMVGSDLQIHQQWEEYVGRGRIAILPNADRVVDLIFMLVGYETNQTDKALQELNERQLKDDGGVNKVKTVTQSMSTITWRKAEIPPTRPTAGYSIPKTRPSNIPPTRPTKGVDLTNSLFDLSDSKDDKDSLL